MRKHSLSLVVCALLAGCMVVATVPAWALVEPYDAPTLQCIPNSNTLYSVDLKICAGASGAPAGFFIEWKKKTDWELNGWDGSECKLHFAGSPSLQHPDRTKWELGPNECVTLTIGDINFDETGVGGAGLCADEPLECGTEYVFRAVAMAGRGRGRSEYVEKSSSFCETIPCGASACTFTMTYWKTHGTGTCHQGSNADEWPASALPMTLGSLSYNRDQLCASLNVPAGGNGLVSLAHQLITAKLNLANGGTSCPELELAISTADALINGRSVPPNPPQPQFLSPALTGPLTIQLSLYNGGALCFPNCWGGQAPSMRSTGARSDGSSEQVLNGQKTTWGKLKTMYR